MTVLLLLLALIALIAIDTPIAVALGVIAVVAMVVSSGPEVLPNVALVLFDGTTKFPLIAIPLFILAGAVMNASGISRRLIALASALFGFVQQPGTDLSLARRSGPLFRPQRLDLCHRVTAHSLRWLGLRGSSGTQTSQPEGCQ